MSRIESPINLAETPKSRRAAPLLEAANLRVEFSSIENRSERLVKAVDGVSLSVFPRQTLAVVGESGCGKSVTALSVMRLIQPPGRIVGGRIEFNGRDLLSLPNKQMLKVRGAEIAMIFQEPMSSLNPVFTIGDQIIEAIRLHQRADRKQAVEIAVQAMRDVGIPEALQRLRSYPHQFSGGMRQRVMIAMALACRPKLLLADEPTTALDVTIQAQILELLRRLQQERGMGIMLITHDLGVVAQNADVVCVMFAGRVVEYAKVFDLFDRPLHPYTRALLQCKPGLHENRRRLTTVSQILDDESQWRRLPVGDGSLAPWWPARGAERSLLVEVQPEHWVACTARPEEWTASLRPPRIDSRR